MTLRLGGNSDIPLIPEEDLTRVPAIIAIMDVINHVNEGWCQFLTTHGEKPHASRQVRSGY